MKVYQFYNKNQFIIYGDNKIIFQSYDSTIAIIQNGKLVVGRNWDYSKTTSKHFYLFLQQYYNTRIINEALQKSNKRKAIQNLIDNELIIYDENLY